MLHQHDWSSMYAPGSEILAYMEGVADKYQLRPYIKLRHELTSARWEEATGHWNLRIKRPSESTPGEYEEFDDWADFVFNGIGVLHRWNWPDIKGLKEFKGTVVHSADWNLGGATWEEDVKDWGNKKVGVIGLVNTYIRVVVRCAADCERCRALLGFRLLERWGRRLASCTTSLVVRPGSRRPSWKTSTARCSIARSLENGRTLVRASTHVACFGPEFCIHRRLHGGGKERLG